MKIKVRDYGSRMDREMQSLCDTLNALPGVHTVDSCGGHGKDSPGVFFFCTSLDSLAQIQRAIDPRYGGQKVQWTVKRRLSDMRSDIEVLIKKGELDWNDLVLCELWEVDEAVAYGDTAHAVEELYDCVAVCLRTIDALKGWQKLGKPETKGETK